MACLACRYVAIGNSYCFRTLAIQFKRQILEAAVSLDLKYDRVARLHAVKRRLQRLNESNWNGIDGIDDIARLKIDELSLPLGRFRGYDEPVFAPQTGKHGSEILVDLDA